MIIVSNNGIQLQFSTEAIIKLYKLYYTDIIFQFCSNYITVLHTSSDDLINV